MMRHGHATIAGMGTTPADSTDPLTAFLAELARRNIDDLLLVALPEPDADERSALLGRALQAATAAGREDLVADAPRKARDQLFRAWSRRGIDPTWFGLNWGRSLGRADDRARLVAAVEDAAVAAVVADLVSDEDVAALREPFDIAASMAGAAPNTNPSSRGEPRRRPFVFATVVVAIFGALVTGALFVAGAILTAAAILAGRGRRQGR
jgi:hypothetical protein